MEVREMQNNIQKFCKGDCDNCELCDLMYDGLCWSDGDANRLKERCEIINKLNNDLNEVKTKEMHDKVSEFQKKRMQEKIEKFCKTQKTCGDCVLYEIPTGNGYKDCEKTNNETVLKNMCDIIDELKQEKVREVEAEFYQLQLTKTQIETLKKFIENNLYSEKLKADSLCDICDIYKQLKI